MRSEAEPLFLARLDKIIEGILEMIQQLSELDAKLVQQSDKLKMLENLAYPKQKKH